MLTWMTKAANSCKRHKAFKKVHILKKAQKGPKAHWGSKTQKAAKSCEKL